MSEKCTKEHFLKCVSEHNIEILRNNGVNRHIRFKKIGTTDAMFDLVTWPNHLCITGDYGSYLFSRTLDMFEFFRRKNGELEINPGYSAEKLLATSIFGNGHKEFDEEEFKNAVMECYKDHCEGKTSGYRKNLWEEIKENVLYKTDSEIEAYTAINSFEFEHDDDRFDFTDFYEYSTESHTFHFIWCLYAITWGIHLFDENTQKQ